MSDALTRAPGQSQRAFRPRHEHVAGWDAEALSASKDGAEKHCASHLRSRVENVSNENPHGRGDLRCKTRQEAQCSVGSTRCDCDSPKGIGGRWCETLCPGSAAKLKLWGHKLPALAGAARASDVMQRLSDGPQHVNPSWDWRSAPEAETVEAPPQTHSIVAIESNLKITLIAPGNWERTIR